MNNMRKENIVIIALSLLASACRSAPTKQHAEEKEHVTGSNIPRKYRSTVKV
jgi:starvation-inducible outer membrane lipoprotein